MILEENFIKDEDGYWHRPNLEKQIDLEKMRHKRLIKEFSIYKEAAQKSHSHLNNVSIEVLRPKICFSPTISMSLPLYLMGYALI